MFAEAEQNTQGCSGVAQSFYFRDQSIPSQLRISLSFKTCASGKITARQTPNRYGINCDSLVFKLAIVYETHNVPAHIISYIISLRDVISQSAGRPGTDRETDRCKERPIGTDIGTATCQSCCNFGLFCSGHVLSLALKRNVTFQRGRGALGSSFC